MMINFKNKNTIFAIVSVFAVAVIVIVSVILFVNDSDDNKTITDVDNPEINEIKPETQEVKTVAEAQKPVEKEPEPLVQKVSFAAVGDNIIHEAVLRDAKENSPEYDFKPMFENISDIISCADFAYINQESPFAGAEKGYSGYPAFNSPDKVGFDLIELGFNVVNLANNHMLDKGVDGYRRTVEFWKSQQNVTYIGGYENKDDYDKIRVVEKNGIKIALLSYTYGINSPKSASDMYVPFAEDEEIDRQTKAARLLADAVVVSIHWGREHWDDNLEPSWDQNRKLEIMVRNNVDVVIGTHPHTLEPMVWKENFDGHKTLVMYSLGNILSNMEYMRNHVGGIAQFDVVKTDGKVSIENAAFVPTVCHFEEGIGDYRIYKLSDYTDEMLLKHTRQTAGPDRIRDMEYLTDIVKRTISAEFLDENFVKSEVEE